MLNEPCLGPRIGSRLDPSVAPAYLHQTMKLRHRLIPLPRCLPTSLIVVVALFVVGCEAPQGTVDPKSERRQPDDGGSYWMPVPTSVRVYPSTRFIRESGRSILEARFELYDEMGDPVKYAGTFLIELFSVDENLGNTPRRLLYSWDASLMSLEEQREHYDPITRGYLFRLGVDNLKISKQTTLLKVSFSPVDRARLEAEAEVRSDW